MTWPSTSRFPLIASARTNSSVRPSPDRFGWIERASEVTLTYLPSRSMYTSPRSAKAIVPGICGAGTALTGFVGVGVGVPAGRKTSGAAREPRTP